MPALPVLFVSHGSPMFAVEPGIAGPTLARFAAALPRPRAILAISPHWMTRTPAFMTATAPTTIHDFGGFPPVLYTLRYAPPGAPMVAEQARGLLTAAGIATTADAHPGFDHGVWVPLMHMYPEANVPITQLSMQPRMSPAQAITIGRALAPLREEGVLIMASGSLTHNLYEIDRADGPPAPYAAEFADWIAERLAANDIDALADYRRRAPHAERAHPTDEHLMPLYYAIGAAGNAAQVERLEGGVTYGVLSMDSFAFGARLAA